MSLAIAGMGWVTPLGNSVHAVWERLLRGDEASATPISEQFADRSYSAFRVPESAVTGLAHPRLRRASVISRFAATAGLEALQAAAVKVDSQNAERIALIFAISNGTFSDQAEQGALQQVIPDVVTYTAKPALGESVGASGLWQVILGAQALRHGELPPVLHADLAISLRLARSRMTVAGARRAIILNSGVNQQVAGLRLALR